MPTEVEPYVLYRFVGSNVELAMWRMSSGDRALALFQNAEAAYAYRQAASLTDDWLVFHPTRPALLELLRATHQAGVLYAVLDPDLEKAKTGFDLSAILKEVGDTEPH